MSCFKELNKPNFERHFLCYFYCYYYATATRPTAVNIFVTVITTTTTTAAATTTTTATTTAAAAPPVAGRVSNDHLHIPFKSNERKIPYKRSHGIQKEVSVVLTLSLVWGLKKTETSVPKDCSPVEYAHKSRD
jgi:hypothetical protein